MDAPKPAPKEEPKTPSLRLRIPESQYQKIMHWVNRIDNEVSGFGNLDWDPDTRTFTVREVFLIKQQVTKAETEMDAGSIGRAMFQHRNEPNALKWHWHSHGNMGVFWSGTDRELIKQLSAEGWLLASVFNQQEEILTAFCEPVEIQRSGGLMCEGSTFREQNFINEVPTYIVLERDPELVAAWDTEFNEHVSERQYSGPTVTTYVGGVRTYPVGETSHASEGYSEYGECGLPDYSKSHRTPDREPGLAAYNEAGYVMVDGMPRYNPCFDADIEHSQFAVNAAIDDMSPLEVEFMAQHSHVFQTALSRWKHMRTLEAARAGSPGHGATK